MQKIRIFFIAFLLALLTQNAAYSITSSVGSAALAYFQQDVKSVLFKNANSAMSFARNMQADILSPKNFNHAMKKYREAEIDFQKGKNLEGIRKKLQEATVYFKKGGEATKLAKVTFTTSLKARSDAMKAEAPSYTSRLWNEAEKKFAEAAGKLEDGDVKAAKKRADEAEKAFRQAELNAIKANYLAETWQLLKQAEEMKVKDQAPKTIRRAQDLIQQAEKELNTNRYDTDVARGLAQQAKYEAKHSLYLSNTIKKLREAKQSYEEVMLAAEKPVAQIAATIDQLAAFDQGFGKTTSAIVKYINTYQDSVARIAQELAERDRLIQAQVERIAELEKQMGGIAQEKSLLAQRIDAQARVREQFARVEQMFSRDEARVFREGENIILRLVGLNFGSGRAEIEPQFFSLLTKVQGAIKVFPGCRISIEGHTDSYGSDAMNLQLSEQRAQAVRQYMLANMRIDPASMTSFGFGESSPIANNKTAEGRTRNRRIDLVINPRLPGTN
ncbi:MAG: OmpA family protein [bacterium]